MANEALIRMGIQLRKGNINYLPQPGQFQATVNGQNGPTPGSVLVATTGTNINLSQLTVPGLCRILNLDTVNYVEYGIWNGSAFFPLGEILAGEFYIIRLSRNLAYGASGTAAVDNLRLRANAASCKVLIEAFES